MGRVRVHCLDTPHASSQEVLQQPKTGLSDRGQLNRYTLLTRFSTQGVSRPFCRCDQLQSFSQQPLPAGDDAREEESSLKVSLAPVRPAP